jgi:hypothetical protein
LVAVQAAPLPQQAPVAGTWTLNVAESHNPSGLPAAPRAGGGGGRRSGGGGDNFDATGGAARAGAGAQAISQLSPEEQGRIRMMRGLFDKAPETLEIVVEADGVTIKPNGFGKQMADGKKKEVANPQVGKVDVKIKLDGKGMTREITTQDDLKIVETYTIEGGKLIVTLKESQPVMKIEDAKTRRVYERRQ